MKRKKKPAPISESKQQLTLTDAAALLMQVPEIAEAFTQADVELALDDRGWLPGGQRVLSDFDATTRAVMVNKSRYYWLRDPLSHQAVRLWTDYAFGDSALSYNSEDSKAISQIKKFMRNRKNRSILSVAGQKRMSTKLLVDGEIFFAIFTDGSIRTFDPLQITVIKDPDDEEVVLGYKRSTLTNKVFYYRDWASDETSFEDPDVKKQITVEGEVVIYHVPFEPLNRRGNGLLFNNINWNKEHRRFMEARVAITQALAKFAWDTNVKGGQAKIDKLKAQLQSTFVTSGTQGGQERNPQNAPGGNWLHNAGIDMKPSSRVTGASEAKDDAYGLKLMVSAGTGIMVHYFGDPSTGNLATAEAMELPMLKMFGGYQKLWIDAYHDIFNIVLDRGDDFEESEKNLIEISLPQILQEDLQKMGSFLTQLNTVFPEIKEARSLLRSCLVSAGVEDIDDVMTVLDAKREEINAQAEEDRANAALQPAMQPAKVAAVKESYDKLTATINLLVEKL